MLVRTAEQLDREIADYIANPKLGDPTWERSWADLLTEKHSTARLPTIDELARALRHISNEYVIVDSIDGEQWAEGLAFGRYDDTASRWTAEEMFKQFTVGQWLRIAARANYLAQEQMEAPRYLK